MAKCCEMCGSKLRGNHRKFCGDECRVDSWRLRDKENHRLKARAYRETDAYKEWVKAYRTRKDVKERCAEYSRRARKTGRYAEVRAAVGAVGYEKKMGRMIRPDECPICGDDNDDSSGRSSIQFHHTRGYSRENRLVGEWACVKCHRRKHRAENWGNARENPGRWGKLTQSERDRRRQARMAVTNAIRAGAFKRPLSCPECGRRENKTRSRGNTVIQFHHTRGYSKRNWFVGEWACKWCHAKEHSKTNY